MDLSDIKLIKTIVDTGSISLASQHLNLSQPTVSNRLARLEHSLGMQLFHRLPRGMTPTTTAEYILRLKLGVRWRSNLLTRPEAYITPLVNRVASLFEAAVSNR